MRQHNHPAGWRSGRDHLRRFGVAASLTLVAFAAWANDPGPVFHTLSVRDGLPDRRPEAIIQDARGFIWIGTRGGLVRHDGQSLRLIGNDPSGPDPLPGRNITALAAHSDGSVWAAVEKRGVVQIGSDLRRRRYLPIEAHDGPLPDASVWSMTEDCDGRLWMAFMRGGVAVFDPEAEHLRRYPQTASSGLSPDGFQVQLKRGSGCRIWLVQTGQVSVFEADKDRFRAVARPHDAGLSMTLEEVDGRLYANTGRTLLALGPVDKAPQTRPRPLIELDGVITAIAGRSDPRDDTGTLFVATTEGLRTVDPSRGSVMRRIDHRPGLPNGLPASTVDGLMSDREGALWLTTTRSGVAYLPPDASAFQRYPALAPAAGVDPVLALAWDEREEGFWVGGLDGALAFVEHGGPSAEPGFDPNMDPDSLGGANVVAVAPEKAAIYVTTQTRLLRVPRDGGEPAMLMQRQRLDAGTFSFTRREGPSSLWVGTRDRGLFRYHEATGDREHFHPAGKGRFRLPETTPRALLRGPQDSWWLLASGGLYRWDEETGFQKQSAVALDALTAGAWDGSDLWLANDRRVVQWRLSPSGKLRRQGDWSLSHRLPPGRMIGLEPDRLGHIWLMRSSGLSVLRPVDGSMRHLSERDGLAAVEFGERAMASLPDGRLAFGGSGGLVLVDPKGLRGVRSAPPVHITRLLADDHVHRPGRSAADRLSLPHDRNNLAFDYLAASYLAPDRTRYRVMLEGWDSDWIDLIGQTRHHYSSLPPGEYRFRVKAAAPDGAWSEAGDALSVIIQPPPWLSEWALGAYVLLGFGGAGLGLRGYRRARRRRRAVERATHKRALAEQQRQILTRLSRSLEPLDLAAAVADEFRRLLDAPRAWFVYLDASLPQAPISDSADTGGLTRTQWRQRADAAEGTGDHLVTLRLDDRDVARVLIERPEVGTGHDASEPVSLLTDLVSQALRNALLLQRVRDLAERAEQASGAKSEFLATMSHEIRTPLHGVLGMVDLLCEDAASGEHDDVVATLKHSGLQLQRIIDEVLDISRIEAGRMAFDCHDFDLVAALEQVVDLHAPNAAAKGLDLRLRIAADLPAHAYGDSGRVSQVLGNLLSNAVKFTERGGIELAAEAGRDGQLAFTVADSGPGIRLADRARLFEPFTQLDASTTRAHSGSGLGLTICRRLVAAMDGQLELVDTPHGGSRFRVLLPLLNRAAESLPMTSMLSDLQVAAVASASTMRVLRRLARRWGFHVLEASGPVSACDLLLVEAGSPQAAGAADLEAWREPAVCTAWLQSPFARADGSVDPLPEGARHMRWPLVESRLIGLLFDLKLAAASPR